MAEVNERIEELIHLVEDAKAMPLSASCVVNRADVLAALQELVALLPPELAAAQAIVDAREDQRAAAEQEAARLVERGRAEAARLVGQSELVAQAQAEAARIVAEAEGQSEAMRREVEDYIDGKLANFEVVLTKTLGAVARGREKMRGRDELAEAVGAAPDGERRRLRRPEPISLEDTGEQPPVLAAGRAPVART